MENNKREWPPVRRPRRRGINIRPIALMLALVLLIGSAVGGTIAWLSAKSETVVNTFTSAQLFANPEEDFTICEHQAVDADKNGQYELNMDEEVAGNAYKILPGVDVPKDPTVDVVELQECGYLYIKVTSNLPAGLSYAIDDTNWEPLAGYSGIWVYKGAQAESNVINASLAAKKTFVVNILKDQVVKVTTDYDGTADGDEILSVSAYMVQAIGNGSNAAEAWANTFGATP